MNYMIILQIMFLFAMNDNIFAFLRCKVIPQYSTKLKLIANHKIHIPYQYHLYSQINERDNLQKQSNCNNDMNTAKKKFALVIGYVGSNYYGLQMTNTNSQAIASFPTIESKLEMALYESGYIRESNHLNLEKIKWSRSSRTDKGVHASKVIISSKLEVPSIDHHNYENITKTMIQQVNKKLPLDIRLFSAFKINQGFVARSSVSWREYEYLLPIELLKDIHHDPHVILNKLNQSLKKFVGTHSFHNFHRLSTKTVLNPNSWSLGSTDESIGNSDEIDEMEELDKDDEDIREKIQSKSKSTSNTSFGKFTSFQEMESFYNETVGKEILSDYFWQFHERLSTSKTTSSIYCCEVKDIIEVNNQQFYRILIRGKSFLLHQIRLMIAATFLEVKGLYPSYTIDLALLAPFHMIFPLAPPEGLILVDAGLARGPINQPNMELKAMNKYSAGYNNEITLMSDEEYSTSETFKTNFIYPRVMKDWYNINENVMMMNDWLANLKLKCLPSNQVILAWNEIYKELYTQYIVDEDLKLQKTQQRILKSIEKFHIKYLDYKDEIIHVLGKPNKKMKIRKMMHKDFLPNSLCTDIVAKYGLVPNSLVNDVLLSIATRIATNKFHGIISNENIIDYIESNGGIHIIAKEEKHPMIE